MKIYPKKYEETTPRFFDGAKIPEPLHNYNQNIYFNT